MSCKNVSKIWPWHCKDWNDLGVASLFVSPNEHLQGICATGHSPPRGSQSDTALAKSGWWDSSMQKKLDFVVCTSKFWAANWAEVAKKSGPKFALPSCPVSPRCEIFPSACFLRLSQLSCFVPLVCIATTRHHRTHLLYALCGETLFLRLLEGGDNPNYVVASITQMVQFWSYMPAKQLHL